MNILIAEDDERLAKSIVMFLERKGHTVTHVLNGRDALAALEKAHFDGVISDINMPGGDGVELLQGAWRTFDTPPKFYVHSSEETHYVAGDRWDLPEVIGSAFKEFASFRLKDGATMLTQIDAWQETLSA